MALGLRRLFDLLPRSGRRKPAAADRLPEPRCFVCDPQALVPPLDPGTVWIPNTCACDRHDVPRLASGRSLLEVLKARDVLANDDWRAVWLWNPVTVEGRRAWFSTGAGGLHLEGEAFPSADLFTFLVQHRAELAGELAILHRHRGLFADGVDAGTFVEYLTARSTDGARSSTASPHGVWERLESCWSHQRSFDAFRDAFRAEVRRAPGSTQPLPLGLRQDAVAPRAPSEEELLDRARVQVPPESSPRTADLPALVTELLAIARQRFAGRP